MERDLIINIVLFLAGLSTGFISGWFTHGWITKRFINGSSQKMFFSLLILFVWVSALIMSMWRGYDVPLPVHLFTGVIVASIFDPEGKLFDKIIKR